MYYDVSIKSYQNLFCSALLTHFFDKMLIQFWPTETHFVFSALLSRLPIQLFELALLRKHLKIFLEHFIYDIITGFSILYCKMK